VFATETKLSRNAKKCTSVSKQRAHDQSQAFESDQTCILPTLGSNELCRMYTTRRMQTYVQVGAVFRLRQQATVKYLNSFALFDDEGLGRKYRSQPQGVFHPFRVVRGSRRRRLLLRFFYEYALQVASKLRLMHCSCLRRLRTLLFATASRQSYFSLQRVKNATFRYSEQKTPLLHGTAGTGSKAVGNIHPPSSLACVASTSAF